MPATGIHAAQLILLLLLLFVAAFAALARKLETPYPIVLVVAGLFRGFDWRIGFVLGAAVATTDAIAATSIAKRLGLPKRLVDLLEGESLVNDATGLLALEFATAMVVDGHRPSASAGLPLCKRMASRLVSLGYLPLASH